MQEGQQKYHGQGEIAEVFVEQVTLCQNVVDDGSDYFWAAMGMLPETRAFIAISSLPVSPVKMV